MPSYLRWVRRVQELLLPHAPYLTLLPDEKPTNTSTSMVEDMCGAVSGIIPIVISVLDPEASAAAAGGCIKMRVLGVDEAKKYHFAVTQVENPRKTYKTL
jgi:hypothetical protein